MCLCYCCYCYWYSISLGVSHCVLRSCCCCRRCCWCRCLSVFGPLSTLVVGSNWIEHTIPIHCVIYLVSSVCSTLNENWFVHFCCVFYYHLCLCFAGWTNFLCSIHCLRLAHGFSSSTEWDIFSWDRSLEWTRRYETRCVGGEDMLCLSHTSYRSLCFFASNIQTTFHRTHHILTLRNRSVWIRGPNFINE